MNWLKRLMLALCVATPLPLLTALPVFAETAAKTDAAKTDTPASKPAVDKDDDPKMSETDKRAKAADCSKQADAKKLHGEARKKFRSACKRSK